MSGAAAMPAAAVASIFHPRRIAVVGASERPGSWSRLAVERLRGVGYAGSLDLVNTRGGTVLGQPCARSIGELEAAPDHLVIAVPATVVENVVAEAVDAGVSSATVYAAGFGEDGAGEGRVLAERLAGLCRTHGFALCGPNCAGTLSSPARVLTTTGASLRELMPGPVAVVGQSGGIAMALTRALHQRGLGAQYMVSSGNELVVDTADYVEHFAADGEVRVIVGYVESVRRLDRFLAVCDAARARGVTVALLKVGRTEQGRRAALTHTGGVVGSREAFAAAAREAGVVLADSLSDLVGIAEVTAFSPRPRGARAGAVTTSGGLRTLLLESGPQHGVDFPALRGRAAAAVRSVLGPGAAVGNPLDTGYTGIVDAGAYIGAARALLASGRVDMLAVQGELPQESAAEARLQRLQRLDALAGEFSEVPVAVLGYTPAPMTAVARDARRSLRRLAFPADADAYLRTMRRLLDATPPRSTRASHMATARRRRSPAARAATSLLRDAAAAGRAALDEVESKRLLALYGIAAPAERLVRSAEEALAAAREVGYPVVVKVVSPDVAHKAAAGGVVTGVHGDDALLRAVAAVEEGARRAHPGVEIAGALVAAQTRDAFELAIGAHVDAEVGPVVVAGVGGWAVEMYDDRAVRRAPVSRAEAVEMLLETRVGRAAASRDFTRITAYAAALQGLSKLASDLVDAVAAVDVNPLVFAGGAAVALDALVELRPAAGPARRLCARL